MNGWVRFALLGAMLAAALLSAANAEAAVQQQQAAITTAATLQAAVRSADGVVRFEFEARPGVVGDGRRWDFDADREDGFSGIRSGNRCVGCTNGPVRVTVSVARGAESDVRSQVGGDWKEQGRDLGFVAAAAAADYLVGLAEDGELDRKSAEEAMQAAVASADSDIWPRLLGIARDRSRPAKLRSASLFWTAHEAGMRAAADIEEIAVATDEETDVQQSAVFALTQLPGDAGTDALLRIARENRNPKIVQSVYFWLGKTEDPRAVALFEEVLLN